MSVYPARSLDATRPSIFSLDFDSFFATAVTSLFEMGWWKKCGRDGCTSDENVIEEKREE